MQKEHPLIREAPRRDEFRQQKAPTNGLIFFPRSIQDSIAAGLAVKGFNLGVIVISFRRFAKT
jgi:hypothetical protein